MTDEKRVEFFTKYVYLIEIIQKLTPEEKNFVVFETLFDEGIRLADEYEMPEQKEKFEYFKATAFGNLTNK